MATDRTLIIRAHGGPSVGSGHIMRCLALAQAWQRAGGSVRFVVAGTGAEIAERLWAEEMSVQAIEAEPGSAEDQRQAIREAEASGAQWIVLDGYCFDVAYQQTIKQAGIKLLVIDDNGEVGRYFADIVLNHNWHAEESLYRDRQPYTKLLLGVRYMLLRSEFTAYCDRQPIINSVAKNILVTLGGADPNNVTSIVIDALERLGEPAVEVTIVAGESNPHLAQLRERAQNSNLASRFEPSLDNMAELMSWADVALGAGGVSAWERAFMGLPSLNVILAANQTAIAEALDEVGAAENLGWWENLDPREIARRLEDLLQNSTRLDEMSAAGRQLIDGQGADRVVMQMNDSRLRLRPAQNDDCRLLWQWVNDPLVRKMSFTENSVDWVTHAVWFDGRAKDPNCRMFIAVDAEDEPLGQVRFEAQGEDAEISVSVAAERRGKGLGSLMIEMGVARLFRETAAAKVHAYIKPQNRASTSAFEKAGFKAEDPKVVRGRERLHYVCERTERDG